MKRAKWPGDWKYDCQRCGFTFPSGEIRKEWTGLHVCSNCWESKHPQLLIKIREETARPSFINRDSITNYVQFCDIFSSSGFADMGTADCMRADNSSPTYAFLLDLTKNGHGGM
jgi:hypothetical protein